MGLFDRGVQMLLTTVGAFAAFSLMTIAVGTDYWLYSRGVCRTKTVSENETSKKNEEVMTHSGLWRTCCLEGRNTLLLPEDGNSLMVDPETQVNDNGRKSSKTRNRVDELQLRQHLCGTVQIRRGNFKGFCKQIDHFPEDTDYEADTAEYFL
ncbi:hypothetical protein Z043_121430, partial [Scleropages formosus]